MTKAELSAIVDTVIAAWQLEIGDRKTLYRTWWRYLGDLTFTEVLAAVDARVVAGDRWAPRVGELRRSAIDRTSPTSLWPDPDSAWLRVEALLSAANTGVDSRPLFTVEVEAAIGRAMRAAGTRDGFHKHAFLRAWADETARREQQRYGLPDDLSFEVS